MAEGPLGGETAALLQKVPLFAGIGPGDYNALLGCAGGHSRAFEKGAFLFLAGDRIDAVGVVLTGQLRILKEDAFGNRAILAEIGPGAVFGESFVCGSRYALSVSVEAVTACEVLFLDFDKVMQVCSSACPFHQALVRNMVRLIAQKNIGLMEKMEVLTKRTLREKILAYLSLLMQRQGGRAVESPLGRVDLADYLGVDRSALTRELNHMQSEGLLAFSKNRYEVLEKGDGAGA